MIPQVFPFRFVGGRGAVDAGVEVRVSGADWWSRGGALPSCLAVEILAQASILLLDSVETGAERGVDPGLRIGGIQDVRVSDRIWPGDMLRARADLVGRFGRSMKIEAELERDGGLVCKASLLLVR